MRKGRDGEGMDGVEKKRDGKDGGVGEMNRRDERGRDGQREKMDIEALEKASWREVERDVQGYGMFGGSSMDVCGGPVLQRGGALKRINGRGLWRGEVKGGEGESGLLWQAAISHPLTQAHTLTHIHQRSSGDRAVPIALPPYGCDTQITRYRGHREASQSANSPSSSPSHRRMHICTHMWIPN